MDSQPSLSTIRRPIVAGSFYPADKNQLLDNLKQAFLGSQGPGYLPTSRQASRGIFGAVVPHAGYHYSASAAAWAFAEMATDSPAAIILLGVNHRGIGSRLALSPEKGWQTPLGISPVSHELSARFQSLFPAARYDADSHYLEHSLEVELPFIQYIFGNVPILPLLFSRLSESELYEIGIALATLSKEANIILLSSSDFSHYISDREARRLDKIALQEIAAVNPSGLLSVVNANNISMCGVAPVIAMLYAAVEKGLNTAKILHYHTSGEVTGDTGSVVGYGTAVIYN